jgi:hypothetical protein
MFRVADQKRNGGDPCAVRSTGGASYQHSIARQRRAKLPHTIGEIVVTRKLLERKRLTRVAATPDRSMQSDYAARAYLVVYNLSVSLIVGTKAPATS